MCSWLLLCFERLSNSCLMRCTYTLMLFFICVVARGHSILTILKIPWSYFVEEWKCLNCSWLLLCFERFRFSNRCLMKSTYTLMITCVLFWCAWTHSINSFRNTFVPRFWRTKMSECVRVSCYVLKDVQIIASWNRPIRWCHQCCFR